MKRLAVSLVAVGLVVGCGGGGGGSGGGGGGAGWLTFSPGSLSATVYEGEGSQWLEVSGTARDVPSKPLYVGTFLDGAIMDDVTLSPVDDMTYRLRVRVKAGLSLGTHAGNIEVRVCEDGLPACKQPYGGAPFRIPVTVSVKEDPGNPTSPANGDFAAGTSGWTAYRAGTASASLAAGDGALHVSIADGGAVFSDLQVYDTPGIDLKQGQRYRLEFDAWADAARTIFVSVQENGRDLDSFPSPYNTYLDELSQVSLGTTPQHFQFEWTQPVTNHQADVDFFLGGSRAGVHIDDVTVSEGL